MISQFNPIDTIVKPEPSYFFGSVNGLSFKTLRLTQDLNSDHAIVARLIIVRVAKYKHINELINNRILNIICITFLFTNMINYFGC